MNNQPEMLVWEEVVFAIQLVREHNFRRSVLHESAALRGSFPCGQTGFHATFWPAHLEVEYIRLTHKTGASVALSMAFVCSPLLVMLL